MTLSNVILDVDRFELSSEEKEIVAHPSVAGVILFSRNFHDRNQLLALNQSLLAIKPSLIIAVDQEGGRVQRFREGFTHLPAMRHWGQRFAENAELAVTDLRGMTKIMVSELHELKVNLSIAPVMDLDYGLNQVIDDRSFGQSPDVVTRLAKVVIESMRECGMTSVGKHFPGHGGVTVDSHHGLPVDDRDWETLWESDMQPFVQLVSSYEALMPAHIIFSKVKEELVSYSRYWLHDILRLKMGFQGAIMSDDLTMNAATHIGGYDDRTQAALEAGCDVLIACNNRAGSIAVLEASARHTQGKSNHYLERYLANFTQSSVASA